MEQRRRAAAALLVGALVAGCSSGPTSRFAGDDAATTAVAAAAKTSSTAPPTTVARTPEGLAALRDQLDTLVGGGEATAVAVDGDVVAVALKPGREDLAEELSSTYGAAVRITVGATVYGPSARSPRCPALQGTDVPDGIDLTITLDQPTVRAADGVSGSVQVTNRRATPVHFDLPAHQQAALLAPRTRQVLTKVDTLPAAAVSTVDVQPFSTATIPFSLAVSRCDGGPGSTLPAGRYAVRVVLATNLAGPRSADIISPEAALELTP